MIYYVYDIRTQMQEFAAAFSNRESAESWGRDTFGEYTYITTIPFHPVEKTVVKEISVKKEYYCENCSCKNCCI